MRIKISNDVEVLLSGDECKYLLLLEFYDEFIAEIKKIQKRPDEKKEMAVLVHELPPLLHKYNIPIQLQPCIESLIEWNEIFVCNHPITVLDVRMQLNRRWLYNADVTPPPTRLMDSHVWDRWYERNKSIFGDQNPYPAFPLIQINRKLSRSKLKGYIDENWHYIEEAMIHFERSTPYPPEIKKTSRKDLEIRMSIYRYKRENKKLSSKEIYKKIQEEYSVDYAEADREVDRVYYEFKKLLLKIGFIRS